MDIIKKLQIVLWVLTAVLVAMPLLDYFGVPYRVALHKVLFLPPPAPQQQQQQPLKPEYVEQAFGIIPQEPAAPQEQPVPTPAPAPAAQPMPPQPVEAQIDNIQQLTAGLQNYVMPAAKNPPPSAPAANIPVQTAVLPAGLPLPVTRSHVAGKVKWIGPPFGFFTAENYRFLIYREKQPVTPKITSVLDVLQGNLVLDLLPFTMVRKPSKILIMLFNSPKSYADFTQRPPWSGASADLGNDTLYVVEDAGFYPLTVHELTHLYFDGFFLPAVDPLWLSEGMAVNMQAGADRNGIDWLDRSTEKFKRGVTFPMQDFLNAQTLDSYPADAAELWYAQAYGIVKYLLNLRSRNEFYQFCLNLKNGMPSHQALYRAYGLPFTNFDVVQRVWLHDLQKGNNGRR